MRNTKVFLDSKYVPYLLRKLSCTNLSLILTAKKLCMPGVLLTENVSFKAWKQNKNYVGCHRLYFVYIFDWVKNDTLLTQTIGLERNS